MCKDPWVQKSLVRAGERAQLGTHLLCQDEDAASVVRRHVEKLSVMMCTCNPSAIEDSSRAGLGSLATAQTNQRVPDQMRDSISKKKQSG